MEIKPPLIKIQMNAGEKPVASINVTKNGDGYVCTSITDHVHNEHASNLVRFFTDKPIEYDKAQFHVIGMATGKFQIKQAELDAALDKLTDKYFTKNVIIKNKCATITFNNKEIAGAVMKTPQAKWIEFISTLPEGIKCKISLDPINTLGLDKVVGVVGIKASGDKIVSLYQKDAFETYKEGNEKYKSEGVDPEGIKITDELTGVMLINFINKSGNAFAYAAKGDAKTYK
jgi:hypothetical protein